MVILKEVVAFVALPIWFDGYFMLLKNGSKLEDHWLITVFATIVSIVLFIILKAYSHGLRLLYTKSKVNRLYDFVLTPLACSLLPGLLVFLPGSELSGESARDGLWLLVGSFLLLTFIYMDFGDKIKDHIFSIEKVNSFLNRDLFLGSFPANSKADFIGYHIVCNLIVFGGFFLLWFLVG